MTPRVLAWPLGWWPRTWHAVRLPNLDVTLCGLELAKPATNRHGPFKTGQAPNCPPCEISSLLAEPSS